MADYNKFYEVVGSLSQLAGLGTVIYGLATQDMETIAGGAAIGYIGRVMTKDCWDAQSVANEMKRNEILKNKQSLEDKLPQ